LARPFKLPFFFPFNKNEATAEGFAYHLLVFWREDSEYYTTVVDPSFDPQPASSRYGRPVLEGQRSSERAQRRQNISISQQSLRIDGSSDIVVVWRFDDDGALPPAVAQQP